MQVNEKIKLLREANQWSQEDMAEKMNMSLSGYAKIERGETNLNLYKLKKIAGIFEIDILELIASQDRGNLFLISKNSGYTNTNNYYGDRENGIDAEIERLKLIIEHKNMLLKEKEALLEEKHREISRLSDILELLKTKLLP